MQIADADTTTGRRVHAHGGVAYYEHGALLGGGVGAIDLRRTESGAIRVVHVAVRDAVGLQRGWVVVAEDDLSRLLRDPATAGADGVALVGRAELTRLTTSRSGEGSLAVRLAEWTSQGVAAVYVVVRVALQDRAIEIAVERGEVDRALLPLFGSPRETDVDGVLHVEGDCCQSGALGGLGGPCPRCGARLHQQPVHGGLAEVCEGCPSDRARWVPRGTYRTDDACGGYGTPRRPIVRALGAPRAAAMGAPACRDCAGGARRYLDEPTGVWLHDLEIDGGRAVCDDQCYASPSLDRACALGTAGCVVRHDAGALP